MVNDRILYEWLQFAGRWDDKTISAKLAAIRQIAPIHEGGKAPHRRKSALSAILPFALPI